MNVARWIPGALYGAPLRWSTPSLAGRSDHHHIALTYDDGPDDRSTPHLLEILERHGATATFFLLGEHVAAHGDLVRHMHRTGHEIAVHGWTHTCVLRQRPEHLCEDLRRAIDVIADVTGTTPRRYRPPYGVTTVMSRQVSRHCGLDLVLWTAWGRDWSRYVSSEGIVRRVRRTIRPGGTVLLHDSARCSAPDSWRRTLRATDVLLADWRHQAIPVGALRDHWGVAHDEWWVGLSG